MKILSRIWFPLVVLSAAVAGATGLGTAPVHQREIPAEAQDTIIYPKDAYRLRRIGNFEQLSILDTSSVDLTVDTSEVDTIPRLTARDTIKVPDSLRLTDPFRYKYYVALFDSLTHAIVCDSLHHRFDSLFTSARGFLVTQDSVHYLQDSLLARQDSLDWRQVDSIYLTDSTQAADAKFNAWYYSLSRKERKRYDAEKNLPIMLARMDSMKKAEEEAQAIKDSIIEYTPRILETFALADSMQFKRIVAWTVDQDFHKMNVEVPDTSYNYYFYDYAFQRKDVNSSWLGVAGSPVQYYNWFNRKSDEGVEFYNAQEAWSFSPRTIRQYNTKTPHTELAYWGTLLANKDKASDNVHLFTTQNITPSFNFSFLFDRWGGGGFLENEATINKTLSVNLNYLGKRYMGHAGYIRNFVDRGENGGVNDIFWIRDTTVEAREIKVNLQNAHSTITKNTLYLDQQLRIPFDFINRIKAKKDSTFVFSADSLDRDITTAFIGHSTEWSKYSRKYTDDIKTKEGADFYNNVFNYGSASADSLGVMKLDNKVFIRLQPWAADGVVSKLNVGVGDCLRHYFDSSSVRGKLHAENSFYLYGGVEGQIGRYADWNAKAHYTLLGAEAGSFNVEADAGFRFYPFRKARTSPVSLTARFETSLTEPNYYQKYISTNHFKWENPDLSKISTTKIQGHLSIPRWNLDATVGYALLANNIYYDTLGVIRQNDKAMSVLSASLRKDFAFGPLHLDNRVLFQLSSNPEVMPLPLVALNLKYFLEFVVQRDETKEHNVMVMQAGVNAFYNTRWYAPSWNPALGVFYNQNQRLYENGPYFDVFVNIQWKRACIFVKFENAGKGWPMDSRDYFTADRFVGTQQSVKLGLFWPFYIGTTQHKTVNGN